jgi:hypothetical protein
LLGTVQKPRGCNAGFGWRFAPNRQFLALEPISDAIALGMKCVDGACAGCYTFAHHSCGAATTARKHGHFRHLQQMNDVSFLAFSRLLGVAHMAVRVLDDRSTTMPTLIRQEGLH